MKWPLGARILDWQPKSLQSRENVQSPVGNFLGEAEVVRISFTPGDQMAKLGLKFHDLDMTATRALQKAINYCRLEEQRLRNRTES